jgi:hypothetical protein
LRSRSQNDDTLKVQLLGERTADASHLDGAIKSYMIALEGLRSRATGQDLRGIETDRSHVQAELRLLRSKPKRGALRSR